jgi:hypothetical protein
MGEAPPPAKLFKALAVISRYLHREFDRNARLVPGISRRSCVLASLAVADFPHAIDIEAEARPVTLIIRAGEGERELHSLGIGPEISMTAQQSFRGGTG